MAKSTDKGKKSTAKVSGKKTTTKEVVSKSPVTKKTTTKPEKAKEKKSPTVSKKVANKKVEIRSVKKPVKITKTEISEKKKPVSITESAVVKTPKVKKEKAAKAPEAPKVKEENVAKAPQVPKVKKEKPYEVRNDKELLGVVVSSPPPSIMKPLRAAVETPVPVTAEPVATTPEVTTPEVVAPVSEDITTVPEPIVSEPVIENNTEMPEMVIVNASNISEVVNSMPDSNSNNQSIPSQHTGGVSAHAHPVVPQSTTLLTSKAITHGDSILHLINSDWRMHAWGGVPIEHIQAVIATGNAEYQYEIKTSEQGAYFLLKYGAESHRFPQDENQFIKLK